MSKGTHQILAEDRIWGNVLLLARTRGFSRVSDYLEPFFEEIIALEREGQDPLAILRKARKKKEG